MGSPKDHRCAVCRRRFEPTPSGRGVQVLCGAAACRRVRDNALARRRRTRNLDDAREDEVLRQRKSRLARKEAAARAAPADTTDPNRPPPHRPPEGPPCHAPTSDAETLQSMMLSLDSWARREALSRASLQREIAGIQAALARLSGQRGHRQRPPSHADLPAQSASIQGVCGGVLGTV